MPTNPFKRRAGGQHVPGAGPPPAPGTATPPAGQPQLPPPAPGRHGGIAYSVRAWNCGRIRIWDGDGNLTWRHDCGCLPPCALCAPGEKCPAHQDRERQP